MSIMKYDPEIGRVYLAKTENRWKSCNEVIVSFLSC